jgi:adenylate cyclase
MNKKFQLWFVALPIIAAAAALQLVYDFGERGNLHSEFLRDTLYPYARSINGGITNLKFRIRGSAPPKNKVVIVEADEQSIETLGRWPWHREVYAELIHTIFKEGAKQVALDVAFPEPEERIPSDVYQLLNKDQALVDQIKQFEGDPILAKVINAYQNKLILGFSPIATCQPGYFDLTKPHPNCPVEDPDLNKAVADQLDRFALSEPYPYPTSVLWKTPLVNILTAFSNIPMFSDAALHSGSFFISPDQDGYVRRYPLFFFRGDKIYPSLALSAAMVSRGEEVKIDFSSDTGLINKVYFPSDPNHPIPVTPLGNIDLNFRGPRESFTYVSALDVLRTSETPDAEVSEKLKDADVFFGVTALGLYDMRAFPFDSNVPGVEGHSTALDNLLSNDTLRSANNLGLGWLPFFMLIGFGCLFAFLFSRFEAVPSLLVFAAFFCVFGFFDTFVLFNHNINFPSAFLLIEILVIFAVILSLRYILEEQSKKFVRQAFSKYLSPSVVDLVLKDPSKLTVGGERKDLTIMFSDLRGFTTFSEKMDPKTLSQFLNEYLSEMTEIIFQYEGTLDKYIGDAVMAFWGAPLDQTNHAELAWKAAVATQKRLLEIAPVFKEKYGIEVGVGLGLNSGVVSVGNMGSKRIFEYTVIGDHVNLASRLESLTRLYGCDILSTRNTVEAMPEAIRKTMHYRKIDSVIVKGKTQAVDLIQVCLDPIPEEAATAFAEAQVLFRNRLWDHAIEKYMLSSLSFEKQSGKPDPVAEIFIKRCEEFKISPPAENWDGTIEMRRK